MQLPQQTSNEISKIPSGSEARSGLKPLWSNATSNRGDLTVERYKTGSRALTPRIQLEDQHLVRIQWAGKLREVGTAFRSISALNAFSLFPAGVVLQEYAMSGAEFTQLSLKSAFIHRVAWEMELQDRFELVPQWAIRDQPAESIAHAAEYEIQSDLSAGALFMESLATALASHLLTRYSSQPVAMREYRGGMSTNQLRRTIDFIEANLGGNFGLAELAANVRISPYYFCRLFKQSTGLSPHQFVIRERIEHARQMLKEHRLTTVEIASSLGFSDQSHFARVFRGLVGTTPKHYASRYR
jgi:AraC family transcriptional regulator